MKKVGLSDFALGDFKRKGAMSRPAGGYLMGMNRVKAKNAKRREKTPLNTQVSQRREGWLTQ